MTSLSRTQALTVTFAYPPSTNRLWRYVSGRAIKSAQYRSWLEAAAWQARATAKGCVEGPYAMHLVVSRPDKRRRDLSNTIKALEDACVHAGLVRDDSDCQRLTAEWSATGEGVRVTIISTTET